MIDLIAATLRMSAPLIFAALGGVISERAGVVNIGLEGMMMSGAFFSISGTIATGNPWIGLICGIVSGVLISAVHAILSISLKADQVVSGVAINLFAGGLASFLIYKFYNTHGQTNSVAGIPYPTEALGKIPGIGNFLSQLNPFVYLAIILVFIFNYLLYKTALGLRIRSVGEHPRAADTLGINVYKIRYLCVLLSGALAGLGGTYLSLGTVKLYKDGMTAGSGFIALAAVIFGNWKPIGSMLACFIFGFAEALKLSAQGLGLMLPEEVYDALPYVLTMLALFTLTGKNSAPLADGIPYDKNTR